MLQGEALHATLSSNPWAVVSVDGISLSRTPVALKLQAKSQRIELRRPGLAPLNLVVGLEHH